MPFLPVSAVLILLVLFQGDAGTAVVMAVIAAGMLDRRCSSLRVLLSWRRQEQRVIAIFITSSVRMRRLAASSDPTLDLNGANDQANAGMFAIASGGWWGRPGASRQKWGSLPEAHTDFIFAVLGEEFGLFWQPGRPRHDRHLGVCWHPDRDARRRSLRTLCRGWYHCLVSWCRR